PTDTPKNEVEPLTLGPKMMALATDKQRAFVRALYDEEAPRKGDGLFMYAARKAGYGTPTSTDNSIRVIAHRVAHDPKVIAATAEYSRQVIRTISPDAVRAVREAVRNTKHKDHIRAAMAIMDRIDPLETTQTVKVEHAIEPATIEMTEKVLARIEALAARAVLAEKSLPPLIEGECTVVPDEKSP